MKPLYFPYTFVSRKTALEISAFFKHFVVYQPSDDPLPAEMRSLVDTGLLEVRTPDASETSRFKAVVRDFQQWGHQQRAGEEIQAAVLRSSKDPVPFFDESSSTQIVADVKQQSTPSHKSDETDSTFKARVFLAFAQEFDRQHQEINGEVGSYRDKVKDLLADIDAEGRNPIKTRWSDLEIRQSDPSEFMVLRRLEAWESLYRKDNTDPGILLTTNRRILDRLNEHIASVERIHQFACASAGLEKDEARREWQQSLLIHLSQLAQAKWPATLDLPPNAFGAEINEADLSLSVYLIPDLMPRDCLARCISPAPRSSGGQAPPSPMRNTIIGLIQPS
jgi:hypothetical protein